MPTTALTIGPVQALVQNQIYAMPARATKGYVNGSLIFGNMTNSTTGSVAITTTGGEFTTAAPFLIPTGAAVIVRLVAL